MQKSKEEIKQNKGIKMLLHLNKKKDIDGREIRHQEGKERDNLGHIIGNSV